jgi:hypothetical protein
MRYRLAVLNIAGAAFRRLGSSRVLRCGLALIAFHASAASASTPVAGAITQDAHWTVANSPYVLSGDVTVENVAHLTIDAGVVVALNAAASLHIVSGSLAAQGTSAQPVVFTSTNDLAGSNVAAHAGDWVSLRFEDGTIDAATTLTHVTIRYGAGVVIRSASPTLNYVEITDQAGPAISLDLASSPLGTGLTAARNQVNGILVPQGAITADVAWRLKGIPYVVQHGILDVGLPPFGLSPSSLQLIAGRTGHLTLHIPVPAPAAGFTVALGSSNAAAIGVAPQVTVPAGEHTADVAVTAAAVGTATITASASGYAGATSSITVLPPPPLSLTPNPVNIGVGRDVNVTVQIPSGSADGDVLVSLSTLQTETISVPPTATIPAGTTETNFVVHGIQGGYASINARATGFADATELAYVYPVTLSVPLSLAVPPGQSSNLTITLSEAPLAGGLTIAIANSAPSILGAPASISIPAGQTSASIPLTGLLDSDTPATLTFSAPGYQATGATNVWVQQITAFIHGESALNISAGTTVQKQLELSRPAPAGGVQLTATSSDTAILDIAPQTVNVPAGASVSDETIQFHGVSAGRAAAVIKSTNIAGVDGVVDVNVTAPPATYFNWNRVAVGKGLRTSASGFGQLTVNTDAPASSDLEVTLVVPGSAAGKIAVSPQTVTIPSGSTASNAFIVTGLDVTQSDVMISATSSAALAPLTPLAVYVVEPGLDVSLSQGDVRAIGEDREFASWSVTLPNVPEDERVPQHLITATSLSLQTVNASPAGILEGFFADCNSPTPATQIPIAADANSGSFCVGSPLALGNYRVSATLADVGQWTSNTKQVVQPAFRFADAHFQIGKGLHALLNASAEFGSYCSNRQLQQLSITSSDTNKVVVEYAAQQNGCAVSFTVRGMDLTSTPVIVTLTANGITAATLPVTVVEPTFAFDTLDGVRSLIDGSLDNFRVIWAGQHSPVSDTIQNVVVSVVNAVPADVLPSPAIVSYNNEPPVTLALYNEYVNVQVPLRTGSYQVAASAEGVSTTLSDVQTVVANRAHLYPSIAQSDNRTGGYPVGRGLQLPVQVQLDQRGANDPPVTLKLVSRQPDFVQVPQTVTLCSGSDAGCTDGAWESASFNVVGKELTPDTAVEVDAYVGSDTVPSATLLISVLPKQLSIWTEPVRAVDGAPSEVVAEWQLTYPCDGTCTVSEAPATAMDLTLATVGDAGGSPVVTQFLDGDDNPTNTLHFQAGNLDSDPVYAGQASAPGTYRVQVTLNPDVWTSDPVIVGVARLRMDVVQTGVGLDRQVDVSVVVDYGEGQYAQVLRASDIAIHAICADTTICSAQDVVIPAGNSTAQVPLSGLKAGTTSLQASAPATTSGSADVLVTLVQLGYDGPSGLPRGTDGTYFVHTLYGTPKADITLNVRSLLPDVASVDSPTVVIHAGQSQSDPIVVHALRTGTTALIVTGVGIQAATSPTIVTTSN